MVCPCKVWVIFNLKQRAHRIFSSELITFQGALWEGRFKSSLVQSERYLLELYRYIELNLVRANLVMEPSRIQLVKLSMHWPGENKRVANTSPRILSIRIKFARKAR